ncbi:hypothetical protein SD70_18615 [Gordoniibacillus kamchatkensis]|uniref:Uncharacterized protein n=1 Tax=Gordoniibacillus kamchatkensis TaxID=1590651 RepID=A0ABR5AH17_9BACL|nr:hypothetical protein SD70_18615 [Paenibacillus sp. VKM B-2647]
MELKFTEYGWTAEEIRKYAIIDINHSFDMKLDSSGAPPSIALPMPLRAARGFSLYLDAFECGTMRE